MTSADAPAIDIKNLTKRFGTFVALDDLTLAIRPSEIFGLVGPNGSGKTTTVNIVSGLSKPTSGSVTVLGHDVARDSRQVRASLGMVPQETALYDELSAWDNMVFHAEIYNVPRNRRDKRIGELLDLVQLSDRRASRVGTFSGGMKRRLALARALLHDPRLLYLDEPTLGVDVQSRRALWDYILELKAQGRTVLITTNYLEEANILCDRIAILDHGKLVVVDSPAVLKRRYGDTIVDLAIEPAPTAALLQRFQAIPGVTGVTQSDGIVHVTASGDEGVTGALVNAIGQFGRLRSITQREPNLDEVFLSLTGRGLRD